MNFGELMPHFAYLDPNAGSILLQVVVGGVLGAGLTLRNRISTWFRAARNMFRRQKSEDSDKKQG